jgi:heptosyltransferase II
MTCLVFAPNWLGDAVMALPALADVVRHAGPQGRVVVAARPSVAGLFACAAGLDRVIALDGMKTGGTVAGISRDVEAVRSAGADLAVLLPNSVRTAIVAWRAGIAQRWGYRHQGRGVLLTRAVAKPRGAVHQVDYYRRLVSALGIANGAREPRLTIPAEAASSAGLLLAEHGWTPGTPLLAIAPGAAFGGAKRWIPERFAQVGAALAASRGATTVIVGSAAEQATAWAIAQEAGKIGGRAADSGVINLAGRTDLPQLCAVLAQCAACVSNDSGAMHVAAAAGVPVVALFGPTREQETAPVGTRCSVMTAPVWCRPCMLRECPLDHRCMTGIGAEDVARRVGAVM